MELNYRFFDIAFRFIFTNIVPFFLVFHLIMRRRKEHYRRQFDEIELLAGEIQVIGVCGYFVILSIYFFSIPALQYINTDPGFNMALIEPSGYVVFWIAFVSYWLVVTSIYLKYKRLWAYRFLSFIFAMLLLHSFFTVLELGFVCIVPILIFSYFLFRLTRPSFIKKLKKAN